MIIIKVKVSATTSVLCFVETVLRDILSNLANVILRQMVVNFILYVLYKFSEIHFLRVQ